ncbi:pseudouridine-5'-phosphate glycosidase [Thalassobacillus sp. CUG 92003]|uniref:pseudouridine-5'-phosphate glycosidase n=1 Tax=Thalassobacillus sp. CUG 92003 TaxID=2736641 RepID=UPI0021078039|nr:pseudouridine-5'-phosphate glycosidase [Thalassobacillus sp. CUG 92003]
MLHYSPEVTDALLHNKPIVALESTIISHGMPYPENVEMARKAERIIREEGAVPATIALMDGKIKIGLTEEEIERLAQEEGVVKTSTRDLAGVLAKKQTGATTVATTAYAADQAGIRFFATGGLGGIHRNVAEHLDISADLTTLAHCNICVVSAGIKSILDVPKTLEFMETLGIAVYGFETERYPGFYFQETTLPVESISAQEAADIMKVKQHLNLSQAIHVAAPIPPQDAMDKGEIETIINQALREADEQHITGKEITPFLLSHIKQETGGASLTANLSLMYNNARIGAKIAVAHHQ